VNRVLYVFLGGGIGSVARYWTTLAALRFLSPAFPFGTLFVNLVGCFFIGFIHTMAMMNLRLSPEARLFLTTGVMGGFTTYSAFNAEALVLLQQGRPGRALGYVCATLIGCAGAGVLGIWGARVMAPSR
jgi:fluoride exporter